MDILLATPINKTHYCVPPLGLGYLISALRRSGFYSAGILDANKEGINYKGFADILKMNRPKILGIQCFSLDVYSVNQMFNVAKEIDRNIITVIGGAHPTAMSEAVFREFQNLDFGIKGEAEYSLPLLAKSILDNGVNLNDIPGLLFKDKDKFKINSSCAINDLDSLGMPAWDLIDPRSYPDEVEGVFYRRFPVAPIITSRGCPYECTFCANKNLMGREIRFRSIEKVVDEIEDLITNFNIKEFHIVDDNFTINKKRVLGFCQELKKRNLKAHIAFPNGVRLDSLDRDILSALKEAGTYSITVGIESGSQRILDHMKKGLTLGLIRERLNLLRQFGFNINAFFIIGYPEEKKEDIMSTIRFAKSLPIERAHFSSFLPLPGTEITQDLLDSGRLRKIDYSELFYAETPFSPDGITKRELKSLQRRAFLSFFLRPCILVRLIFSLRSFRQFRAILRRARAYIFSKSKE